MFEFKKLVGNGCRDLMLLCLNISNIAIITVKSTDYRCIIHDISKSEAIYLLKNSVRSACRYIYKVHIK